MNEYSNGNGVYNGWHWRFLTILVVGICGLELVAYYTLHYPMQMSVMLGSLIVIYVAIPRLKERRLAHAIIGVIAVVLITAALEAYLDPALFQKGTWLFFQYNGLALLIGLLMSFVYLRLTDWSNRKRQEQEDKRREKAGISSDPAQPQRQHGHYKGKKKKKGKRR